MFTFSSKAAAAVAAFSLIGGLLLSGCAPAASAAPAEAPAAQTTPAPAAQTNVLPRTITVVGRGEVESRPDVATSNIGVEAIAPTVADAMKDAQDRMAAVTAALKAAGIAANDIQTSNFSINFERQGSPEPTAGTKGATQVSGVYHVSNMVNVTIRELDKVGAVIDAAVEAGANDVWGVNFGLDEKDDLESQAREKAAADARARAEALAKLHGVTLGSVVSVSEVVGGNAGPMTYDAAAKGMGGGGTPVEPGELTFSTQIQVVYAIQ